MFIVREMPFVALDNFISDILCVVFLRVDSPVLFCSVDDGAHLQLSIYLWPPVLLQFHLLLRAQEHTECQSTAYCDF